MILIDNYWFYSWILIPILIFSARVIDVSLGTIRIIFISKGIKYLAPLVGFFEIFIWLLAINQIFKDFSNIYYYFFYAGGFATGSLVGILIDEKLSIGTVGIRIITKKDADKLIQALKIKKINLTVLDAEGPNGKVKVIFTVINRQNIAKIIKIVKKHNPKSFYSIEDIRYVSEELPYYSKSLFNRKFIPSINYIRKGK